MWVIDSIYKPNDLTAVDPISQGVNESNRRLLISAQLVVQITSKEFWSSDLVCSESYARIMSARLSISLSLSLWLPRSH